MKRAGRFALKFPTETQAKLKTAAASAGITRVALIRVAVESFLRDDAAREQIGRASQTLRGEEAA